MSYVVHWTSPESGAEVFARILSHRERFLVNELIEFINQHGAGLCVGKLEVLEVSSTNDVRPHRAITPTDDA